MVDSKITKIKHFINTYFICIRSILENGAFFIDLGKNTILYREIVKTNKQTDIKETDFLPQNQIF